MESIVSTPQFRFQVIHERFRILASFITSYYLRKINEQKLITKEIGKNVMSNVDVQLTRTSNVNVKITRHSYSNDSNKGECAKFVLQFDSPLQNGMNEDGMNEWNLCAIDTSTRAQK